MSNGGTPRNKKRPDQPANEPALPGDEPVIHLVPGDDAYHHDKQLIADLTALNGQISRYVLRHLDAEAGRAAPASPDEEVVLGERIIQLGEAVQARAEQRQNLRILNGSVVEPDDDP